MRTLSFIIFFLFFFGNIIISQNTLVNKSNIKYDTTAFFDNFNDGNFNLNPKWYGDTDLFVIDTTNGENLLNLHDTRLPVGTSAYIYSPVNLSLNTLEWQFYAKLVFNLSTYLKVYIISDAGNLSNSLNGFYLKIYKVSTGVYKIDLNKQTGSSSTLLASSTVPFNDNQTMRIKIIRKDTLTNSHNWKISADYIGNSDFANQLINVNDNTNINDSSFYFGFVCKYSSSHKNDFFFDDIYIGNVICDTTPPFISNSIITNDSTINIYFSEAVDTIQSNTLINYRIINKNNLHPIIAQRDNDTLSLVKLTFSNKFKSDSLYLLQIDSIADLKENIALNLIDTVSFHNIKPLDLVINEILFDPYIGNYDFIELYNNTDKEIDLKNIYFSYKSSSTDTIEKQVNIISSGYFISPNDFVLITTNPPAVIMQYYTPNPDKFIVPDYMPALNIESGMVKIVDNKNNVIDEFHYAQTMQFPLLNNTKGISLERINYNRSTQDASNWHSAAQNVGFATPAYKNSQFCELINTNDAQITIVPEVFSPDNDGVDDIISFYYKFDDVGWVANAKIYDSNVRVEKELMNNILLSTDGVFSWNGINDDNIKSIIGIYVLYIELYNLNKNIKKIKKTFVLTGKLK